MAKDDKTFENLPGSAVEYINLVIKNMRYRKKARDEVREELIDHFELHLKDCATNEEKEQKAQQLISEFGDPKLLAVLMRRAKKRCRPLWRTVVARIFQALAAMIILLILYIAWFLSGKPVITTNYIAELNKIVRPSADDSTNAYPLYNKAIETLVDVNNVKELLRLDFNDVNDRQKELMRQWLAKNQTPLELVTKASELPYFWKEYRSKDPEQSMMSVLLPNLPESRAVTYAICWRASFYAEDGNIVSAFRNIETAYRFGRHNKGDKSIVEQLVGIHIEGRALGTTRRLLDAYKMDSNALADFQQRLQNLIDNDGFRPNLRFEKLFMFDEIQRCFTERSFGPSHIYPKRITELTNQFNPSSFPQEHNWLLYAGVSLYWPISSITKSKTITQANAFYEFWDQNLSKTPAQIHSEGIDFNNVGNLHMKDNLVLRMLEPALARFYLIAWRNKIDAESTPLIIALVRYRQDTGAFPESLDRLVEKGYIKQVPVDPFSDKPIAYRKTDNSFLLYSWGDNLKDDDGQIARDEKGKPKKFADTGDWVFWPLVDGRYDQKK